MEKHAAAPGFNIEALIDGKPKLIRVKVVETSDGVPYYSCWLGEDELVQVRKETYGIWEQLWGHLSPEVIAEIGRRISEKITPP